MSPFPSWLHRPIEISSTYYATKHALARHGLATVCESARCPNMLECFSRGTSTVLVLGRRCTRACRFCSVEKGSAPEPVSFDEPGRLARWVGESGLSHVVVTSVTRDDLSDGGAAHFAACAKAIKARSATTVVELLIPDCRGDMSAIDTVARCEADIIGHNVETVPRLYSLVRPQAAYDLSCAVLARLKKTALNKKIKSSMIVGLGETDDEVKTVLRDLAEAGCDIVVLGQYLRPGPAQMAVARFVTPETFAGFESYGRALGIGRVAAGPWLRSSYRADSLIERAEYGHVGTQTSAT